MRRWAAMGLLLLGAATGLQAADTPRAPGTAFRDCENCPEMVVIPAGSFVTHFGKQVHYDGAKDGEVILQIVGMGPATSTQVTAGQ